MNINPVDLSQAQELLLELVHVLCRISPFAARNAPISLFLSRRFVLPTVHNFQDQHPIRLLTQLQAKVDEWIGETGVKTAHLEKDSKEVPIARQAKLLIFQVQEAIGKLCTSTYIQNREEAPFRQTLQSIKPHLDRMVEALANAKIYDDKNNS